MTKKTQAAWLLLAVLATIGLAASPVISVDKVHLVWEPTAFHAEPSTRAESDVTTVWRGGGPKPQFSGADGNWVAYPAPSSNADRMCSANVYDIENNKMYMMGGDPAGYYGVAYNQRFDPVTNTWVNMADMPGARTWLDGEGSYCRHLRKIYIAGGYTGSANNNMWAYDIATNTWETKASMPTATLAYASCIWNDSLIYILGGAGPGLGGSNVVQVYNVNQNVWQTATSLPEYGDMGSGCLIGDTIYITNMYNRQMGTLWSAGRKGVINPSNPLSITWSNLPPQLAPLGFNGGTVELGGYIYRFGGFGTLYVGSDHKRGWRYRPSTGQFETLPWCPSPPNRGVARCNILCGWEASNELAKVAGDDEGDWNTPNNTYYRNQFTPPHDVCVSEIVVPSSPIIQKGDTLTPKVKVKNIGLNPEAYIPVAFQIDSAGTRIYDDAVLITDTLDPGEEVEVTFTNPWTIGAELWHGYFVSSFTSLSGDMLPQNDTMNMYTLNTTDTIYSNRVFTAPSIDGYMAPGEWSGAYFVNASNVFGWGGRPYPPDVAYAWFMHDDHYLYAAYALPLAASRDPGDQIGFYCDENNDGQWATDNSEGNFWYWINGSNLDEVLFRPITPSGAGTPGVAPGAQSATSTFNGYLVFECKTPFGVLPYQLNLNPDGDTCHLWFFENDGGRSFGWWNAGMPADSWLLPYWYGTLILQSGLRGDVGVTRIDAPLWGLLNSAVTPKATWKNFGSYPMSFTAFYLMDDPDGNRVYTQSQYVTLNAGEEQTLTFPDYTVTVAGNWVAKCSTVASTDTNPANDILSRTFRVSAISPQGGWVEMKNVPRMVKDGGWLASNPDNGLIYGYPGYKATELYAYDPVADNWSSLALWPSGMEGKPGHKGSNGCYGEGYIYAVKGNNTPGFWRYSIADNTWQQLENIPPGNSGKNPKGGTDVVYVATADGPGYVYLLKGYKQDFMRYNTATGAWEILPDAPIGMKPKWDKGSWLVFDGDHTIYAHKAKYHELWTFDIVTRQWSSSPLQGMPFANMQTGKNKKSKDGSDAGYDQGFIYALKGGNTCEFYKYNVSTNTWSELPLMPDFGSSLKRKRVKQGGALTAYGNFMFYAFKGGKTQEFWRFYDTMPVYASIPERSGVMGERMDAKGFGFSIAPNPVVKGYGMVSYSVPQSGEAKVTVFDVTGRAVLEYGFVASGTGMRNLDLRSLSAGVYLVRFEAAGASASEKLIVE